MLECQAEKRSSISRGTQKETGYLPELRKGAGTIDGRVAKLLQGTVPRCT